MLVTWKFNKCGLDFVHTSKVDYDDVMQAHI